MFDRPMTGGGGVFREPNGIRFQLFGVASSAHDFHSGK